MAGPPGFDEQAERWWQTRTTARSADDPKDPMARFRNTSRSMFVDRKDYTGGALRGAVSERRAEWMGGGAGGRLGEDWRNHQAIDVDRHGSGLDPFSYAVVKKVKGGVDKSRQRRAGRRAVKDQFAKAESAGIIEEMRTRDRTAPAEAPVGGRSTVETFDFEPPASPHPLLNPNPYPTPPENAKWEPQQFGF